MSDEEIRSITPEGNITPKSARDEGTLPEDAQPIPILPTSPQPVAELPNFASCHLYGVTVRVLHELPPQILQAMGAGDGSKSELILAESAERALEATAFMYPDCVLVELKVLQDGAKIVDARS